jgi:hypothetical protein
MAEARSLAQFSQAHSTCSGRLASGGLLLVAGWYVVPPDAVVVVVDHGQPLILERLGT